jgi:hypothetical protein
VRRVVQSLRFTNEQFVVDPAVLRE